MDIEKIKEMYVAPFKYDRNGQQVFDSNNHHILDIRGWGRLEKKLGSDGAVDAQDKLGQLVVKLLNEHFKTI